jgi:hypothetical protein
MIVGSGWAAASLTMVAGIIRQLNREQALALGALGLLLFACVLALGFGLAERTYAVQEFAVHQEMLTRLQARAGVSPGRNGTVVAGRAPAGAFLDAPSRGLAGAQLQAYLARLAKEQQAALLSSGAEAAGRDDAAESIRMQAVLELKLKSLQALLYQLETGTPYIFVDALTIQPPGESQRGSDDPLLRLTIGIRALWRQG